MIRETFGNAVAILFIVMASVIWSRYGEPGIDVPYSVLVCICYVCALWGLSFARRKEVVPVRKLRYMQRDAMEPGSIMLLDENEEIVWRDRFGNPVPYRQ